MKPSPLHQARIQAMAGIRIAAYFLLLAAAFGAVCEANAASIELPPIFGDNMVLQQSTRGRATVLWGWSRNKTKVTVRFNGQAKPVEQTSIRWKAVHEGWFRWEVEFENLQQGEYTVQIIQEKSELRLSNVLVGEVWISCFEAAENVGIRPELLEPTRRTLAERVRFLVLQSGSFNPGGNSRKGQGWRTLADMLNQGELATWNFHFGRALIDSSKGAVRNLGIVISPEIADNFKREELARIKKNQLPDYPCPTKTLELDSGYGAPCEAIDHYAEDYRFSARRITDLISRSKRRQTIRDEPAPGESIPSKYFYLHTGNVPALGLSIRGLVCKTR